MPWYIARKEILSQLLKLKFSLSCTLVIVLMAMGGVLFLKVYTLKTKALARFAEAAWQQKNLEQIQIFKSTSPLELAAEGREWYLPSSVTVKPNLVEVSASPFNPFTFLSGISFIDWVYIVQVLFSLMAIILAFDSISGEKEEGTLRLLLANSVSRVVVLSGKFIGLLLTLMVPLALGLMVNLLIVNSSPEVRFALDDKLRLIVIVLLSIIYVALFIAMSLSISALCAKSEVALVILLLLWVMIVFIIPNTAPLLASRISPVPSEYKVAQQLRLLRDSLMERQREIMARGGSIMRGQVSRGAKPAELESWQSRITREMLEVQQQYDREVIKIKNDAQSRLRRQVETFMKIASLSPASLYEFAATALAETGYFRQKRFVSGVERYMQIFTRFSDKLRAEKHAEATPSSTFLVSYSDPEDPRFNYSLRVVTKLDYSRVEFNENEFPRFIETPVCPFKRHSRVDLAIDLASAAEIG